MVLPIGEVADSVSVNIRNLIANNNLVVLQLIEGAPPFHFKRSLSNDKLKREYIYLGFNEYERPRYVLPVFLAIDAAFSAALVIYAAYVLRAFTRHQGCALHVPHVILVLHIIANIGMSPPKEKFPADVSTFLKCLLVRIIKCIISSISSISGASYQVMLLFMILSMPFTLVATLLIPVFWSEAMNKRKVKPIAFLDKYKIPFYVFSAIVFVGTLTVSIITTFFGVITLYVFAGIWAIISIAVCIVFWVVGFRLRRELTKAPMAMSVANVRLLQVCKKKKTQISKSPYSAPDHLSLFWLNLDDKQIDAQHTLFLFIHRRRWMFY